MASAAQVSRRSFLGGALAATALASVPLAGDLTAPIIYADGVNDDTAGLQALFDGKPFRVRNTAIVAMHRHGRTILSGGHYLISDTLRMHSRVVIENVYLETAVNRPALRFA